MQADAVARRTARALDAAFPWWEVIYSGHWQTYTAFPRHSAPVGVNGPQVEHRKDPRELASRMREVDAALLPHGSSAVTVPARPGDGRGPFLARQGQPSALS
ncbi:hypothetical protein GCM10022221_67300 [Actinocorallia aurea]